MRRLPRGQMIHSSDIYATTHFTFSLLVSFASYYTVNAAANGANRRTAHAPAGEKKKNLSRLILGIDVRLLLIELRAGRTAVCFRPDLYSEFQLRLLGGQRGNF